MKFFSIIVTSIGSKTIILLFNAFLSFSPSLSLSLSFGDGGKKTLSRSLLVRFEVHAYLSSEIVDSKTLFSACNTTMTRRNETQEKYQNMRVLNYDQIAFVVQLKSDRTEGLSGKISFSFGLHK